MNCTRALASGRGRADRARPRRGCSRSSIGRTPATGRTAVRSKLTSSRTTSLNRCPADVRLTIRAGPPASSGRSRFTSTKWPRWLVPNWVSKPSAVRPSGVAMTPALAMMTSSRSWSASTPSVKARTDARDARSTARSSTSAPRAAAASRTGTAACSPFARSRTPSTTLPPCAATTLAVSWPSPADAPVTRTRRPDRSTPSRTSSVVDSLPKLMATALAYDGVGGARNSPAEPDRGWPVQGRMIVLGRSAGAMSSWSRCGRNPDAISPQRARFRGGWSPGNPSRRRAAARPVGAPDRGHRPGIPPDRGGDPHRAARAPVRRLHRRRSARPRSRPGRDLRLPRPERCGQVDHRPDALHAHRDQRRKGVGRRLRRRVTAGRRPPPHRRRTPGRGARPEADRARAAPLAGPPLRPAEACDGAAGRGAGRAHRPERRARPPDRHLLRGDAPAPGPRGRARAQPRDPVPRRADDGVRPGEPHHRVERGAPAQRRARHDDLPDHAVPRGSGRAVRPGRDHQRRAHRRRGHARRPQAVRRCGRDHRPGRRGPRGRCARRSNGSTGCRAPKHTATSS